MTEHLGERPSKVAPVDLGSAFGTGSAVPDRAAGLRGLGGLTRAVGTPAPASTAAPAVTAEAPTPAPQRRQASRQPGSGVPVVVYLPVSIRDRLRTYADAEQDRSYTDIVLDAIDETHERLTDLVAPARGSRPKGSLFKGRERARRRHDEPQVQVSLRPSRNDLGVIDRLVREHRAGSRSALIAAALDTYLPRT